MSVVEENKRTGTRAGCRYRCVVNEHKLFRINLFIYKLIVSKSIYELLLFIFFLVLCCCIVEICVCVWIFSGLLLWWKRKIEEFSPTCKILYRKRVENCATGVDWDKLHWGKFMILKDYNKTHQCKHILRKLKCFYTKK